jgi:hypothetical protein
MVNDLCLSFSVTHLLPHRRVNINKISLRVRSRLLFSVKLKSNMFYSVLSSRHLQKSNFGFTGKDARFATHKLQHCFGIVCMSDDLSQSMMV